VTGAVVVFALLVPTPGGVAQALVELNSWLPAPFQSPTDWVVPAVLLHSAILGGFLVVVSTYQWEMIGRGVSESRRGQALALAFGAGPILAFLSSLASQLVLAGKVEIPFTTVSLTIPSLEYPWTFASLFAITVPLMAVAAFNSTCFIVPPAPVEIARPPFVAGIFGGLGDFFSNPVILLAAIAFILVGSGYNVLTNIGLFTKEAIGEQADQYVGIQNALRFGFKAAGGLLLGWLLTRTNPRAGMLATGAFCLASVLWVLAVPGKWFLLSFGLMGVGELFGVYYPNYILSCSAKSQMRRNMAFTSMLNMPLGFVAVAYGLLGDVFGLRASFALSSGLLVVTLLIVQFTLPARPRPREVEPGGPAGPLETAIQADTSPAAT
jgi:hypothetical protein